VAQRPRRTIATLHSVKRHGPIFGHRVSLINSTRLPVLPPTGDIHFPNHTEETTGLYRLQRAVPLYQHLLRLHLPTCANQCFRLPLRMIPYGMIRPMGQRNGDRNQRMNLPQRLTLPQRHTLLIRLETATTQSNCATSSSRSKGILHKESRGTRISDFRANHAVRDKAVSNGICGFFSRTTETRG
jgi:hypothetical protein